MGRSSKEKSRRAALQSVDGRTGGDAMDSMSADENILLVGLAKTLQKITRLEKEVTLALTSFMDEVDKRRRRSEKTPALVSTAYSLLEDMRAIYVREWEECCALRKGMEDDGVLMKRDASERMDFTRLIDEVVCGLDAIVEATKGRDGLMKIPDAVYNAYAVIDVVAERCVQKAKECQALWRRLDGQKAVDMPKENYEEKRYSLDHSREAVRGTDLIEEKGDPSGNVSRLEVKDGILKEGVDIKKVSPSSSLKKNVREETHGVDEGAGLSGVGRSVFPEVGDREESVAPFPPRNRKKVARIEPSSEESQGNVERREDDLLRSRNAAEIMDLSEGDSDGSVSGTESRASADKVRSRSCPKSMLQRMMKLTDPSMDDTEFRNRTGSELGSMLCELVDGVEEMRGKSKNLLVSDHMKLSLEKIREIGTVLALRTERAGDASYLKVRNKELKDEPERLSAEVAVLRERLSKGKRERFPPAVESIEVIPDVESFLSVDMRRSSVCVGNGETDLGGVAPLVAVRDEFVKVLQSYGEQIETMARWRKEGRKALHRMEEALIGSDLEVGVEDSAFPWVSATKGSRGSRGTDGRSLRDQKGHQLEPRKVPMSLDEDTVTGGVASRQDLGRDRKKRTESSSSEQGGAARMPVGAVRRLPCLCVMYSRLFT